MQDYEALKEIEAYGEREDDRKDDMEAETDGELFEDKAEGERKYSLLPLFQVACCALILLTMLYLKLNKPDIYSEAIQWYQQHISEEIEMPHLVENTRKPSPAEEQKPSSFKDLDNAEGHSV